MTILGTSRIFLALLLPILLGGCALHLDGIRADNGGNPGIAATTDLTANELPERRDLTVKGMLFHVEVVRTTADMERGLMYRASMPRDHGMLFAFSSGALRTFWMKNTVIPLDIIFADEGQRVVKIWKSVQPCGLQGADSARCPVYASEGSAQYVLELNAGLTEEIGLRIGDRLEW
jgi:uncharacterized membrane protein (UPF0127 family)